MGLTTRLALARTLVWTGLQNEPKTLAERVRQLCSQRADLIVISQPDAIGDDLLIGYRAARQAADGRAILGIRADARLAARSTADLVVSDAGTRIAPGHPHGLVMAVAEGTQAARQALADARVDAVVLPAGAVTEAARLAPPADPGSKPWFAAVDSVSSGRTAVEAGARRLAFPLPGETGVRAYRQLLDAAWRDEMEQVSLAAFAKR